MFYHIFKHKSEQFSFCFGTSFDHSGITIAIMSAHASFSLEWFGTSKYPDEGATTFRLIANDIVIFLDTWLERPSVLEIYLKVDEVEKADYIFVSHAHFDHLPGADRLAIRTSAVVIGNCEAINILRKAGVPEEQLFAVAGGERIPLFTQDTRKKSRDSTIQSSPAPPGAPPIPDSKHAAMTVDVWPSLHCLLPAHDELTDVLDTRTAFRSPANPYLSTFDMNRSMRHGLLHFDNLIPPEHRNEGMSSFIDYIKDRKQNVFSDHDGGQLMYNIHITEDKTVLWNAHLGSYQAILGVAGMANHNGRPFKGSAAEFLKQEVEWLDHPEKIIWCLHDQRY
ncbi:Hypothetical protein D9617_5g067570 [Elsinoe fawcettii]|nr:Hypothetical protein D9617_5g067570 [Elsinoe fawcettii]